MLKSVFSVINTHITVQFKSGSTRDPSMSFSWVDAGGCYLVHHFSCSTATLLPIFFENSCYSGIRAIYADLSGAENSKFRGLFSFIWYYFSKCHLTTASPFLSISSLCNICVKLASAQLTKVQKGAYEKECPRKYFLNVFINS